MTDYRGEGSIGGRIRAARRDRGYRTTRELADALAGTKITESVLENIESGRKADLTLGQFLSIAYALRVPPSYLLARLVDPAAPLDLPHLSDDLHELTGAEFDAWFSGVTGSAYRPQTGPERRDRDNLESFRELHTIRRELTRLNVIQELKGDDLQTPATSTTDSRMQALRTRETELTNYLLAEGFRPDSQPER